MTYIPRDNSWCINVDTEEDAHLVEGCCDKQEKNSSFTIISEPYCETVLFDKLYPKEGTRTKKFINIRSSKTGNVYRVLYNEYNVRY